MDKMQDGTTRRGGRLLSVILLAALALVPGTAAAASAAPVEVLVVRSSMMAHDEVIAALRAGLGESGNKRFRLRERTIGDYAQQPTGADLIITVGVEAASTVLRGPLSEPVYCTFLPQTTFGTLVQQRPATGSAGARVSALYLDQPDERRLRLLRLALPQAAKLGVVLGPESRAGQAAMRRSASAQGIELQIEVIDDEKQLIGALHRVMAETDALYAVPDPLVFNRHTAQNILLTAYRLGKPVIGYSRAYVNAGALLALHSTPAQVGRQLAETLLALPATHTLPPPRPPRYFSLEINERVAHSLGLSIGQAEEILQQLRAVSGEETQ